MPDLHPRQAALYLDGIVTAVASTPGYDLDVVLEKLSADLAPIETHKLEAELEFMIERLEADMDKGPPTLPPGTEDTAGLQHWVAGYILGITFFNDQWHALANTYPVLDSALVIMGGTLDRRDPLGLKGAGRGPVGLEDVRYLIPLLAYGIYHEFYAKPATPWFEAIALQALDEDHLFQTLMTAGANVPLDVIDECAGRGETMIPLLERHITACHPAIGIRELSDDEFWGVRHAVMVLGRMAGGDAGDALRRAFHLIATRPEDDDLPRLLHDSWWMLFKNKPATSVEPLKPVAEDGTRPRDTRLLAVDVLVTHAATHGGERLEHTLDWVAALCGREDDDPKLRLLAGIKLLGFPRERHRPLLEALGRIEPGLVEIDPFAPESVEEAFARGDITEWTDVDDSWDDFYDDFGLGDARPLAHNLAVELFARLATVEPQTRKTPKVGRNDPCPCGSGRKYKKCCLNKP
ncbi:MAG: SEC-C metal-binding domain-containing protein [Gammaproteobacteria bacterium]|nr:SEC-C metal-binding domain-containing protein [Gammaproteobacteria bacterium]